MKRLVSLAVSLAFLAILYWTIDGSSVLSALSLADPALLGLSLILLVLLVAASAWRLHRIALLAGFPLGTAAAVEATFAANALNMVLPGKAGDLLKAVLMAGREKQRLPAALALGIWEKIGDLAMLLLVAGLPLLFQGGEPLLAVVLVLAGLAGLVVLAAPALPAQLLGRIGALRSLLDAWRGVLSALGLAGTVQLLGVTGLIWLGHLLQICLMAAALGVNGPTPFWISLMAMLPVAIVAGLVPLTFAGIGVRDAALVVLLGPLIGVPAAAALGILFWLRYLVPGLLGAPLIPKFLRLLHHHARESPR